MDRRYIKMPNGATVSDWIGTAETAASLAASHLYDARRNSGDTLEASIETAMDYLLDALDELKDVRHELDCTYERR